MMLTREYIYTQYKYHLCLVCSDVIIIANNNKQYYY